jgi:hypothetical protein
MALTYYKKELAKPGVFQSAQGEVVITPKRIDHWLKTFNKLRKEGFNFPVPWGHKLQAVPTDEDPFAQEENYARWNSGNINRLEKSKDGSLWMIAETPPGYKVEQDTQRLVNEKDGTVVTDVSPGIGDWTDGQGREHKDIILHAALCTHPVQHNQTGFLPASGVRLPDGTKLLSSVGTVKVTCFLQTKGAKMASLKDDDKNSKDNVTTQKGMADDNLGGSDANQRDDHPDLADQDVANDYGVKEANYLSDKDGDKSEGDGDKDDMDPTADPKLPKMPDGSDAPELDLKKAKDSDPTPNAKLDEYVGQLKDEMAKLGQPLMDDTDRNNVVERVLMALKHAANAGASLSGPPTGGADDGKMPDLGVHGTAEPSGAAMGTGGVYSFMSTRTGKVLQLDSTAHKFASQAADAEKALIASEWDKLAAVGPAAMQAIAHQEKNMLQRQFMSVNPDTCNVISKTGRERLAFAKSVLKASGYFEFCSMLSTSVPLVSPSAPAQGEDESQKEIVDDLVSRAYGLRSV